jgi:hypothetical protein
MIDKTKIDGDYKIRVKKIVDLARLTMCLEAKQVKEVCYNKHGIDTLNLGMRREHLNSF